MEKYLIPLKIEVYVYLLEKATTKVEHKNIKEMKTRLRNEPQSLSFSEFWEDLVEISQQKEDFEKFSLKINEDFILIKNPNLETKIYKEDLQDFWQTFRENGYFFPNSKIYYSDFNNNYDLIFQVLEKLDYLENVESNKKIGLQLKTKRLEPQLVLF